MTDKKTCDGCINNNGCLLANNELNVRCLMYKDKSKFIELPCKVYSVEYDCYVSNEYIVNEINLNNIRAFTDKKKAEKVVWELNK